MEISSTDTFPLAIFLCFFLLLSFSLFLFLSVSLFLSYRVSPSSFRSPSTAILHYPLFLIFFVPATIPASLVYPVLGALQPLQPDREYFERQRDAVIFFSIFFSVIFLKSNYKIEWTWRR